MGIQYSTKTMEAEAGVLPSAVSMKNAPAGDPGGGGADGLGRRRPGPRLPPTGAYFRPLPIALASEPVGSSPENSQKNAPPKPLDFT